MDKEHLLLQQMYRAFAETEVEPVAADVDATEEVPMENVKKMAKYGFFGIPFPKEYGGQGADYLAYSMAVEELSKKCATTGVIVSAHTSLCCAPIYENGTEEQKKKYLPDLLAGKKIGAFGLTEPGAGTDASGQRTTAVLDGDEYVLNGSKIFITNAGFADVFVIIAMTDKEELQDLLLVNQKIRWVLEDLLLANLFLKIVEYQRKIFLEEKEKDLRLQ